MPLSRLPRRSPPLPKLQPTATQTTCSYGGTCAGLQCDRGHLAVALDGRQVESREAPLVAGIDDAGCLQCTNAVLTLLFCDVCCSDCPRPQSYCYPLTTTTTTATTNNKDNSNIHSCSCSLYFYRRLILCLLRPPAGERRPAAACARPTASACAAPPSATLRRQREAQANAWSAPGPTSYFQDYFCHSCCSAHLPTSTTTNTTTMQAYDQKAVGCEIGRALAVGIIIGL